MAVEKRHQKKRQQDCTCYLFSHSDLSIENMM
ncbi:hypothetical protein C7459_106133 [Tumebacillus permanentifrigoris]|uniref:Uncharacterized protein n=1 Tax=Tumebacillus permanentifrigoris TaxID=378543 RepID=A0A316DC96_9BACL|nr:hypothetical protein C7459_106133 [Tumebacillus permanentifrigoris]